MDIVQAIHFRTAIIPPSCHARRGKKFRLHFRLSHFPMLCRELCHQSFLSYRRETCETQGIGCDDERLIADALVIILNRNGFEATAAYSGETAIELSQSMQPEMIISDVIMNGINGIDAAIQIRSMLAKYKILLFSGHAAMADLLDQAGSQGHKFEVLAKPVHPQDLLRRLRS
jgi:CheY-like chemotaxis protein